MIQKVGQPLGDRLERQSMQAVIDRDIPLWLTGIRFEPHGIVRQRKRGVTVKYLCQMRQIPIVHPQVYSIGATHGVQNILSNGVQMCVRQG